MNAVRQRYDSPPGYGGGAKPFHGQSGDLTVESNFFKVFGEPQNGRLPVEEQHSEKANVFGAESNMTTHEDPFFDFDPAARTDSPFPNRYSTPPTAPGNLPGWGTDISFQPLSPPQTASLESKGWDFGFPLNNPPNILTDLQFNNARSQYGQVTPPDEENQEESILDRKLREQDEGQAQTQTPQRGSSGSSTARKRPRANATASKEGPAKRTRKSASRNATSAGNAGSAPNKPEDVRRSKFLERNRVAASKCRQKKKEWTQNLEGRAREIQKNNNSMRMMVDSLRQEIQFLRSEMKKHDTCDCTQIQNFIKTTSSALSPRLDADEGSTSGSSFKKENSLPLDLSLGEGIDVLDQRRKPLPDDEMTAAEKAEIASDEGALEALLTRSINRDDADATV